MWRNWKTRTLLVESKMVQCTTLRSSLEFPQIYYVTQTASIPKDISNRNKNICLHKNLYANVHSRIIHSSSKV